MYRRDKQVWIQSEGFEPGLHCDELQEKGKARTGIGVRNMVQSRPVGSVIAPPGKLASRCWSLAVQAGRCLRASPPSFYSNAGTRTLQHVLGCGS